MWWKMERDQPSPLVENEEVVLSKLPTTSWDFCLALLYTVLSPSHFCLSMLQRVHLFPLFSRHWVFWGFRKACGEKEQDRKSCRSVSKEAR